MIYEAPFPAQLARVEFMQLSLHFKVSENFDLPEPAMLQLRREMLEVIKDDQRSGDSSTVHGLKSLLLPELPVDPSLLKQVQKPSPAFVLHPDLSQHGTLKAGQTIVLPVALFGPAMNSVDALIELFRKLGKRGLHKGRGKVQLDAVESRDASGVRSMLWMNGEPSAVLIPPINDLAWWLEGQSKRAAVLRLELLSPLRVVHQGRPLFKADFEQIFPFILRRVTSFFSYYGQLDLTREASYCLDQLNQLKTHRNKLFWQDWRQLQRRYGRQNLGGLMGFVDIAGSGVSHLLWVLQLGSLLNFGKGAAYGAGQYALVPVDPSEKL
ncbi:MAG: CRISPR system precrRNA processing endoribonuclease RAMP protein Cas6 [Desulfuromonadales bacterium]|nr:CRISPR system precrRNA processing endoribonuclease RAMP protein Cas6 [Desulfuromonadales bacterium]MBN2791217.1 CRISPR system precrRNA processing endoribonuclease RAMP protein Cas6 [Desulfuromonadales bacterium]